MTTIKEYLLTEIDNLTEICRDYPYDSKAYIRIDSRIIALMLVLDKINHKEII